MIRRIKQMKFKSSFSMSEFIRINHINEQDIFEVETHGDDIVLHYYINIQEDKQ